MVPPLSNDTEVFQRMLDRFNIKVSGKLPVCSEIISLDPPLTTGPELTGRKILGAIISRS